MRSITVIGGGLSGTLLAVEILRLSPAGPIRVILVHRERTIGAGVAYRTRDPRHLLNVRTRSMSMDARDPEDLLKWLHGIGRPLAEEWNAAVDPNEFLPRGLYAEYVKHTFERAEASATDRVTVERVHGHAVMAGIERGSAVVRLADGRTLGTNRIVLALGNPPPGRPTPEEIPFYGSDRYVADPWADHALTGIRDEDRVLVIGTNLTMIDLVLTLSSRGHRGPIIAISRHGLMSARHAAEPGPTLPPILADGASPLGIRRLVRAIRIRARDAADWRHVVDTFRSEVTTAWQRLSEADRRRFAVHVRPFWEVHRHRAPGEAMDRIDAMRSGGQLHVRAARVEHLDEHRGAVTAVLRPRGARTTHELTVDRVLNATGPQADYRLVDDPLLRALFHDGWVRPGPLGVGLDASPDGAILDATGKRSDVFSTLGPPLRGVLWESTAVPEIREQARALAERLVHEA